MYIAIEGLIGTGKSTLLMELKKRLLTRRVHFVFEPVLQFNNFSNRHQPLALAYEHPSDAAISQAHIIDVLEKYYHSLPDQYFNPDHLLLGERTLFAPKLFVETRHKLKLFGDFTREWLLKYSDKHLPSADPKFQPDIIIFLNSTSKRCMANMSARNRAGECAVPQSFLDALNVEYQHFKETLHERGIQVHTISVENASVHKVVEEALSFLRSIRVITPADERNGFQTLSLI